MTFHDWDVPENQWVMSPEVFHPPLDLDKSATLQETVAPGYTMWRACIHVDYFCASSSRGSTKLLISIVKWPSCWWCGGTPSSKTSTYSIIFHCSMMCNMCLGKNTNAMLENTPVMILRTRQTSTTEGRSADGRQVVSQLYIPLEVGWGCNSTEYGATMCHNCRGNTLWLFNIAMENGPFIDDFPFEPSIYRGFSMAMLNNQMVNHTQPTYWVCYVRCYTYFVQPWQLQSWDY